MNTGTGIGALLFAIALMATQSAVALEPDQEQEQAANPDAKCVKCHSRGLKKKLEDGETMSSRSISTNSQHPLTPLSGALAATVT